MRETFQRRPNLLIPLVAVSAILLFTAVEYGRAWAYRQSVAEYKQSATVLSLKTTVDKLQRETEKQPAAYYCDLSADDLLALFNQAYEPAGSDSIDSIVQQLHAEVSGTKPPAFSSALNVFPGIVGARRISEEVSRAVSGIRKLTESDVRTTYCMELQQVLAQVYFLPNLSAPEGVSALLPGQQENFQVNVRQAQEQFASIRTIPKSFADEHARLGELLESVASNLRANRNDYDGFSRALQQNAIKLQDIVDDIGSKAKDLRQRPQEIALQASILE